MKININPTTQITTPDSWNQLTTQQALTTYGIIMQETGNFLEPHELLPAKRIFLTQHLMQVDDNFLKAWEKDCIDANHKEDGKEIFLSELQQLTTAVTAFLFEEEETEDEDAPKKFSISLSLTKCPYPEITYTRKKKKKKSKGFKKKGKENFFYGPADGLNNITIYELGQAFTVFENYIREAQAGDDFAANHSIHHLLAILYREGKPETKANQLSNFQGDRRLPYLNHESTVERRMEKIKFLPEEVKQLLLFWFASCRQTIINSYRNVFQTSTAENLGGNQYGWGGTLLALADKDLSKLDSISKQNAHNALTLLSLLEDERKALALKTA